jgi:uncharacterized protein (TIGR02147 family)
MMETPNNQKADPTDQKVDVFAYTSYRELLKDLYNERKKVFPAFSYRYMGQRVGFTSAGFFSNIIQGKRNISNAILYKFCELFKFSKKESEYFELLVSYDQSDDHTRKKYCFERILSMRKSKVYELTADRYKYFENWYNVALRELLNFYLFKGDYADLAKKLTPPISPKEAQKSVALLEKLELIRKKNDGSYEVTEKTITSYPQVPIVAVHNFQLACMDLAKQAIDRFPFEERSISTLTLSVSKDTFKTIAEKLAAFRHEVLELVKHDQNLINQVYQFNFQIFPMTQDLSKKIE